MRCRKKALNGEPNVQRKREEDIEEAFVRNRQDDK